MAARCGGLGAQPLNIGVERFGDDGGGAAVTHHLDLTALFEIVDVADRATDFVGSAFWLQQLGHVCSPNGLHVRASMVPFTRTQQAVSRRQSVWLSVPRKVSGLNMSHWF